MRYALIALLFLIRLPALATESEFTVSGIVTLNAEPLSEAEVSVFRNAIPSRRIKTDRQGRFRLVLDLNSLYLLEFNKTGCFPLKVNISTELPAADPKQKVRGEFELSIDMIRAHSTLEASVLNSPIAQIRYIPELNGFDYDKEYFEYIRSEVDRLYEMASGLSYGEDTVSSPTVTKFHPPLVNITGQLFLDEQRTRPLRNHPVELFDRRTASLLRRTLTDSSGTFRFQSVDPDSTLDGIIKVKSVESVNVLVLADGEGKILGRLRPEKPGFDYVILPEMVTRLMAIHTDDPWLRPLTFGDGNLIVVTDHINYGSNQSEVSDSGKVVLDKLVAFLERNPSARVEITAHTDAVGEAAYNYKLSERRAAACIRYLRERGIDPSRVKGTGRGETELVNFCSDNVVCDDFLHRQNRRTEFLISRE